MSPSDTQLIQMVQATAQGGSFLVLIALGIWVIRVVYPDIREERKSMREEYERRLQSRDDIDKQTAEVLRQVVAEISHIRDKTDVILTVLDRRHSDTGPPAPYTPRRKSDPPSPQSRQS